MNRIAKSAKHNPRWVCPIATWPAPGNRIANARTRRGFKDRFTETPLRYRLGFQGVVEQPKLGQRVAHEFWRNLLHRKAHLPIEDMRAAVPLGYPSHASGARAA